MDRSERTVFLGVILSTLVFFAVDIRPAWGNSCSFMTRNEFCALVNVSIIVNDDVSAFVWPNKTLLFLLSPTILYSGTIVFSRIPTIVDKLYIHDGSVSEVSIRRTLYEFIARRNQVRQVNIDEEGTYHLKEVEITYNQLRSIPANITKLTNLVKLYLHDNEIETVNMDIFNNLNRLELLALQCNRIAHIDTKEMLHLSNLAIIGLGYNCFESLLIQRWNFSNLREITLHHNRLQMVQNLSEQFPNLNETSLGYNKWSCVWLEQTVPPILNGGKMVIYGGGETCSGKSVRGICCYDSVEDIKNSMEKSMKNQFDQIAARLERAVQQIEGKISTLDNKLDRTDGRVKFIGDDRKNLETKISAVKGDTDRMVQRMKEEIKSLEASINTKVNQNRDLISNGREQLGRTHNQMQDEFKWVKEKLNVNRALIDNVVEDLYLEAQEKQKM